MSFPALFLREEEARRVRVLHLHSSDYHKGGGGSIAMYRLHTRLREAGVDSRILCADKTVDSPSIEEINRSWPVRIAEKALGGVAGFLGLNNLHRVSAFQLKKHDCYVGADIVHIHSIHGNFFSYLALPSVCRDKQVVYTLHDMWPYTGHCCFSYDCDRWKIGCGKCPYLEVPEPVRRDSTRWEWKLKDWAYSRSNMSIVALCTPLAEQVRQSILGRFPLCKIPNGVDVEVYKPLDREFCRRVLGIPVGKNVVMVAAQNLDDPRKGGPLLLESLEGLPEKLKNDTVLLVLGKSADKLRAASLDVLDLGYVSNDRLKAMLYSSADLFVHATRGDNLPLVLLESIACGTPVVSFDVGGIPDVVRPGITGYLARPENPSDLRRGIVELLEDDDSRESMSEKCREIAVREYSMELHVRRHIELYERLVERRGKKESSELLNRGK